MMADRWENRNFAPKVHDILLNANVYHENYYASGTFGGPSLHFHRRALGLEGSVAESIQIELIYAVLTSWGMHRMGSSGSKMQPFGVFEQSVVSVNDDIRNLQRILPQGLSLTSWMVLERVFKGIKVMASGTTIVGNSKVMAHLLPALVAPIDRQYTLNYLFGNTMFQNSLQREWQFMRKIHSEFYYPIANDTGFREKTQAWLADGERFPWDTSILKVIDNLVIGAMRNRE
jgi:hypothetical protein